MKLPIFCQFGLKTPIHAPRNCFFGGFHLQNGEQYQRNTQKAGTSLRESPLKTHFYPQFFINIF